MSAVKQPLVLGTIYHHGDPRAATVVYHPGVASDKVHEAYISEGYVHTRVMEWEPSPAPRSNFEVTVLQREVGELRMQQTYMRTAVRNAITEFEDGAGEDALLEDLRAIAGN